MVFQRQQTGAFLFSPQPFFELFAVLGARHNCFDLRK
jgi:hypothetical protein